MVLTAPTVALVGASSHRPQTRRLDRADASIRPGPHSARYHFPPGVTALREQVARHSVEAGCRFEPGDFVITSGGMDAASLALKAVAKRVS